MSIRRTLLILLLTTFALPVSADHPLPRTTPESQGVLSSAVLEFINAADEIDAIHSFMLVRHGHVVAEGWWAPYDAETPHILYSLSKSFASTAVGLAVGEGLLSVEDPVIGFFPDDVPADASDNLRAMTVHDILRMNTGHETEPPMFRYDGDTPGEALTWTQKFFAHPVDHEPGSRFLYNSPATYMQSAIVQKLTGETVVDYLGPRLFEPLGFEDPRWLESPEGVSIGAFGFMARTEEIAKFGQLYLQEGEWNGQQLIPADWVREATSMQTENGNNPDSDWNQGYGYQFWMSRHDAYRGDGAFGQFCIVLPEQDAVVAITSGTADMQGVLNLVWDELLPSFRDEALAEDATAHAELQSRLAALMMRMPAGESSVPLTAEISGRWFEIPENDRGIDAVAVEFDEDSAILAVRNGDVVSRTPVGLREWTTSSEGFSNGIETFLGVHDDLLMAASGAWTAADTFTVKLVARETPFYTTLVFQFDGDRVVFDSSYNVAFGPTQLPQLVGEAMTDPE